jgi:hypothetical protein
MTTNNFPICADAPRTEAGVHGAQTSTQGPFGAAILAAALLLPGMGTAHAEAAPERGDISFKYMDYQDSQTGFDRVSVRAPSLSIMTPLAGVWSVEGTVVSDTVSGASPRYHTAISGASHFNEKRTGADVGATRYFQDGTLSVGAAFSDEHDYLSRALSFNGTRSSEDKNTTWSFGISRSHDSINPVNLIVTNQKKDTNSFLLGVTQVLTPVDIVQLTATYSRGNGYFSDPYKFQDQRPNQHNETAAMLRWNHHFAGSDGTSHLSYRYYTDSYEIKAHTFTGEYVQPLADGWTVTPSARFYTQSAASFYFDPTVNDPFPPGGTVGSGGFMSADQRLSGFGALTLGFKVAKQLDRDWRIDVKLEEYQQRGSWRLFDGGSPGLAPLRAQTLQIGLSRLW